MTIDIFNYNMPDKEPIGIIISRPHLSFIEFFYFYLSNKHDSFQLQFGDMMKTITYWI